MITAKEINQIFIDKIEKSSDTLQQVYEAAQQYINDRCVVLGLYGAPIVHIDLVANQVTFGLSSPVKKLVKTWTKEQLLESSKPVPALFEELLNEFNQVVTCPSCGETVEPGTVHLYKLFDVAPGTGNTGVARQRLAICKKMAPILLTHLEAFDLCAPHEWINAGAK